MLLAPKIADRLASLKRIVLGSASPRRSQILRENMHIKNFEVIVSGFAEDLEKTNPRDYVAATCYHKALEILQRRQPSPPPMGTPAAPSLPIDLLITADTIVVCDEKILEKPGNVEEAMAMLSLLSGRKHQVLTAVSIALRREASSSTTDYSEAAKNERRGGAGAGDDPYVFDSFIETIFYSYLLSLFCSYCECWYPSYIVGERV